MQKVKLSTNGSGESLARQTPGLSLRWKDFQFYVENTESTYDWWIICDGLSHSEEINIRKGHTIFLTGEPPAIKSYNKKFLDQFDIIITSQPNILGKNVIHTQTALAWTLYSQPFGQMDMTLSKNYDDLKKTSPEKTKLISVVTSNKNHTEGHRNRLRFIEMLQKHFGDKIDVFGPGLGLYGSKQDKIRFKYHENKWEALAPYKYHIAIENSVCPDYWTEKISESFVAESYPFYFGCPNILDYFSDKSFTPINILKPDEAINLIEQKIKEDTYAKSLSEIKIAKNLVLEKYQIFPMLTEIFEKRASNTEVVSKILYPESYFQNTLSHQIIRKIKSIIKLFILRPKKTKSSPPVTDATQKWLDGYLKPGMLVFEYSGKSSRVYEVKKQDKAVTFLPHIPHNSTNQNADIYIDKLYYFPDNYFDLVWVQDNAEIDDSDITLARHKVKSGGVVLSKNTEVWTKS
jgi:hypothetical protein